jgi:hypothetical protein
MRCFFALTPCVHSRFVECVYLSMVFRYKSNMHRFRIGLSFFEPEKSSFAVTKTLQIRLRVVGLEPEQLVDVVHRVFHDDLHFRV